MDLVLATVNRCITDEEEDLSNQLVDGRHRELSLRHAWFLHSWDTYSIQDEERHLERLFDFENLLGSFFCWGKGAHKCHEMAQIVFAKFNIFIIFDLRSDFANDLFYKLHLHDVFSHVWRDAQRPQKGIEKSQQSWVWLQVSKCVDLVAYQLEKRDPLGLCADVDWLHEQVLEFDVLAGKGNHGH